MAYLLIDTANLEAITAAVKTGFLSGVTTNPSLVAQASPNDLKAHYDAIIAAAGKDALISFEVIATDYAGMVEEGRKIHNAYPKAWVKIPVCPATDDALSAANTLDGLKAIRTLSTEGITVNCTLIHRASQGMLAAAAGAYVLSPFVGRVNDHLVKYALANLPDHPAVKPYASYKKGDYFPPAGIMINGEPLEDHHGWGISGVDLVEKLISLLGQTGLHAKVLAASIRREDEAQACAAIGTHYLTLPPKIFMDTVTNHPEGVLRHPIIHTVPRLHPYPISGEEVETLLRRDPHQVRKWLTHPQTVDGMKGFLADAEKVKEAYAKLFQEPNVQNT